MRVAVFAINDESNLIPSDNYDGNAQMSMHIDDGKTCVSTHVDTGPEKLNSGASSTRNFTSHYNQTDYERELMRSFPYATNSAHSSTAVKHQLRSDPRGAILGLVMIKINDLS